MLEKFRDQIASHGRAVFRRGSNVINGFNRSRGRLPRQMQKLRLDCLSFQHLLHLDQTKWDRRHAAQSHANILNLATAKAAQRRNAHFGDGLSVASPLLSRILKIPRKPSSERDGSNQLIGRQVHLLVTRVESELRDPKYASNGTSKKFTRR